MLSLAELSAVLDALTPLVAGARLQRLVQTDEHTLYLELYGWDEGSESGAKRALVLSCHPQFGRISDIEAMPKAPAFPPPFAEFLKSRLGRDRLTRLRIIDDDRQVGLRFEGKDGGVEILLSLMGPRSNIYALDLDGKLLAAMKPLSGTRNDLRIGATWVSPPRHMQTGTLTRWPAADGAALLDAVRHYYAAAESDAGFEYLQNVLRSAIRRELEFALRKETNLRRDLDAAKHARENKRLGELLKTVMADVRPGMRSVTARDFETGEDVTIPLDPTLNAAENMDKLFKSYHKGLVGTNMLGQQLEITQSYVSDLRDMMTGLEAATDAASLQEFAERPAMKSLRERHFPDEDKPKRPPKKKPEKKEVPSRLMPRRYLTSDGLEVWVGRSSEGNDYLTTKLANGNDLFFHVEGYPGSHTILRVSGKKDPPPESLLEAGELAVQYSKLKDATKATLHIAPIKNVHKPKDAKPGLVYVNKGKTLQLRRDKKRLERILAAAIKE